MQNYSDNSNSDDSILDQARDAQSVPDADKQIFFPDQYCKKLIVLDTLFFGIYSIFWMFMNWKYLNEKARCEVPSGRPGYLCTHILFSLLPLKWSNI